MNDVEKIKKAWRKYKFSWDFTEHPVMFAPEPFDLEDFVASYDQNVEPNLAGYDKIEFRYDTGWLYGVPSCKVVGRLRDTEVTVYIATFDALLGNFGSITNNQLYST